EKGGVCGSASGRQGLSAIYELTVSLNHHHELQRRVSRLQIILGVNNHNQPGRYGSCVQNSRSKICVEVQE
ncbi:hypothetical protein Hamer_G031558, partial [Homarus americanus]